MSPQEMSLLLLEVGLLTRTNCSVCPIIARAFRAHVGEIIKKEHKTNFRKKFRVQIDLMVWL